MCGVLSLKSVVTHGINQTHLHKYTVINILRGLRTQTVKLIISVFDGIEYFLKHKVTTVNMYDVDVIKTVYDVNKVNFLFFFKQNFVSLGFTCE